MRVFLLSLLLVLAFTTPAGAQSANSPNTLKLDEGHASPAASIDALHWIAGSWRAETSLGTVDETWTLPLHGTMAGAFKVSKAEGIQFYEFLELREIDKSLVYRVKHFDAELRGWEARDESVDFALVRLEENAAYFNGLTYRLRDDGTLDVFVVAGGEGDETQELNFTFHRLDGSSQ